MKNTKMLKKNYEFRKVLSKGKYYSGNKIEAFIQENNKEYNFLGLAISSKVANAVTRNNIKRLIRENYKNIEDSLLIGYSFLIIINKKKNIKEISYKNIKEDFENILKKAGIINEKIIN